MNKKIALACDAAGFPLIQEIKDFLNKQGYKFIDFGTFDENPCDYPIFAARAARAVANGECELGILICGTGIGVSITANRIPNIRCALCHDVFSAKATRQHNDANMLAMGARVIGAGPAFEILAAFLATPFSGEERHARRIALIDGGSHD